MPVLRGGLLMLGAAFTLTYVAGLAVALPPWLLPAINFGVYVLATGLVLLRALHGRGARISWWFISAGLCCYTAGTAYAWIRNSAGVVLPFPSLSDVGWLAFYPLAYAGILLVLRGQAPTRRTVLDGAIAGLGSAAVFSAVVVDKLVTTNGAGDLAQYVALAYPLGDALLVGTVLTLMTAGRWAGAPALLLTGGFGSFILADVGYVTLGANGHYQTGVLVDGLYLAGLILVAFAAWQPARLHPAHTERNRLGISIWFAFGALAVTLVATRVPLSNLTVVLAGLTLVAVVLRVLVSFRELEALGRARHDEARRDALTGLANRRAVLEVLAALPAGPVVLLLLDLDKFKDCNDTYGHQAGDLLLAQAAQRLGDVTRPDDVLGRLGGDEFVLVLAGEHAREPVAVRLAGRIRAVLREPFALGDGVEVTIDVSVGIAASPVGGDADLLFRQADIAMYAAKRAGGGHALYREPPPAAADAAASADAAAAAAGGGGAAGGAGKSASWLIADSDNEHSHLAR